MIRVATVVAILGLLTLAHMPLASAAVVQAVDNDPQNQLWDCTERRVPFGSKAEDRLRCFSFRFTPPAGGITSAVLYATIEAPTNSLQDTDATVVAVGQKFDDCAGLAGKMTGCIIVHGGFKGGEVSLTVDLLKLNCDPTYRDGTVQKQQAMVAQLNTGVVHMLLQDDTAVHSAQLVLNEGAPTTCGTSTQPVPPNVSGGTPTGQGACTATGATKPTPAFGSPEPTPTTCMTLQAGQRNVIAGQTEWVPIWMINGTNVANINFDIAYDSAVAVAERGAGRGSFFANALGQANTEVARVVRIGYAQTTGENGSGTIAWIKFRAVGQPGTKTPLRVTVTTINEPGGKVLTIDRIDGLIQIVGPDGMLPGDCDGNGSLNEADALCALQMSVQLVPVRLTLDMDKDGTVTSRDSTLILQKAVGRA